MIRSGKQLPIPNLRMVKPGGTAYEEDERIIGLEVYPEDKDKTLERNNMLKLPAFLQRFEVGTSLITVQLLKKKPIFMVKVAWYLLSRKIFKKPRYKNFLFAPHYKCNFTCDHCSQARLREEEKNQDVMTTEEMISAIKKCLRFGALSIDFIGGESLLYKDFDKLVEACNPSRTFVTMVTNGSMLNEKMIKHLMDIGVDKLNISIDSWYPDEHDKMRGVKGAHKRLPIPLHYVEN